MTSKVSPAIVTMPVPTNVKMPVHAPVNKSKSAPPERRNGTDIGPENRFIQSCNKALQLHCSYWRPEKECRALAFICHGFGEHLQWYQDLAHRLSASGVFAFGHDHVGHGRSEGIRGHVGRVDEYTRDVIAHCEAVRSKHKGKPCFLVGHSMGGMIGIRAATSSPSTFAGLVLMGPLIKPNPDEATPFKLCAAKVISAILPLMPVTRLNTNHVTRDEEMRKKMNKDPLRYHGGVRARWAMACHEELFALQESIAEVTWPFLLLHGIKDKLCSPQASENFYDKAKSKDKKIKMFPDAFHHLFLEIPEVRKEALEDTVDWIKARLPPENNFEEVSN